MPQSESHNAPAGSGSYVVRDGDCLLSIAARHGLLWKTLWDHADNAPIRDLRKDPSTLLVGDRVSVPEVSLKEESCATEERHRFRRLAAPAKLRVQLLDEGEPRAAVAYRLVLDGRLVEGQTDGDGFLEAPIAPNAGGGELIVDREDGGRDHYRFTLGTLGPIDSVAGQERRLQNLGYDVADLASAVKQFQTDNAIDPSGDMNEPTRARLKEVAGQ